MSPCTRWTATKPSAAGRAAARRSPASPCSNPNGTVAIGFTIITTADAIPVHVDSAISLATLGGTWRDSVGGSGRQAESASRQRTPTAR